MTFFMDAFPFIIMVGFSSKESTNGVKYGLKDENVMKFALRTPVLFLLR